MQLVLDTNVVLDVLVFGDAGARPLAEGLRSGALRWLATGAMRAGAQHDRSGSGWFAGRDSPGAAPTSS